jgi:hypothetical protein
MSFTYDFTTAYDISVVRLLIPDTDSANPIFQDAEINVFLQMESSQNVIVGLSGYNPAVPVTQIYSYRRAAALGLMALAGSKSRLGGMLKVLDIQIDTTKAAAMLKDQAKEYIDQEANAGYFAVSEMVQNQFSMRERLYNMALRQLA